MSTLPQLSDRDKAIINSIFNPSLPLGEGVFKDEFEDVDNIQDDDKANPRNDDLIKMEILAIQEAENGNYEESINILKKCSEISPNRAATYNNRAQVYQLQGDIDACMEALAKAIELSNGSGRACCQALCQRGILYRKDGKEDAAREDFHKAAKLGSTFAKQQLIELNPYAALCNQMLSQVMNKLNSNN